MTAKSILVKVAEKILLVFCSLFVAAFFFIAARDNENISQNIAYLMLGSFVIELARL